jgi:ATP-binding cassette subfamily B protein
MNSVGKDEKLDFKNGQKKSFYYVYLLVKLLIENNKAQSFIVIFIRFIRAVIGPCLLYIAKLIIDQIVQVNNIQPRSLYILILVEILLLLTSEILSHLSDYQEIKLGNNFTHQMNIKLMRHTQNISLQELENSAFSDQLERARRQTVGKENLINQLSNSLQNFSMLIFFGFSVSLYNGWIIPIIILFSLPVIIVESRFSVKEYEFNRDWTQKERFLDYLRSIVFGERSAKEVKINNMLPWLLDRYQRFSKNHITGKKNLNLRHAYLLCLGTLISLAGYYLGYYFLITQTLSGMFSVGTFVLISASLIKFRDTLGRLISNVNKLFGQGLYLRDLFAFLNMNSRVAQIDSLHLVSNPIKAGIEFVGVGFKYPNSDRWCIKNLSFKIRASEKIGIIGENGAGKSTLIKLMSGLLEPTTGKILLDGIDIKYYEKNSLRNSLAILFQDYFRYDLRFDENIAVGNTKDFYHYLEDSTKSITAYFEGDLFRKENIVPEKIKEAAIYSGAASLTPKLPQGYQQRLGYRFAAGVELSGGEWQKLALARTLIKRSQIIILDEPTSSLDAIASEKYQKMLETFIENKISITISHRISIIRKTDRVLVLKDGNIEEQGSHSELIKKEGIYRKMCEIQNLKTGK